MHCIPGDFIYAPEDEIALLYIALLWNWYYLPRRHFFFQYFGSNEPTKTKHGKQAAILPPIKCNAVNVCCIESNNIWNGKNLASTVRVN